MVFYECTNGTWKHWIHGRCVVDARCLVLSFLPRVQLNVIPSKENIPFTRIIYNIVAHHSWNMELTDVFSRLLSPFSIEYNLHILSHQYFISDQQFYSLFNALLQ